MATEKSKGNKYSRVISNPEMVGGNHKAQTVQGILQEGRKSYKETIDNKLGTQTASNKFAKTVNRINPPAKQAPTTPPPKAPTPKR